LSKFSLLLEQLDHRIQVRIFATYKQIKPEYAKKLHEKAKIVIEKAKRYSQTPILHQMNNIWHTTII